MNTNFQMLRELLEKYHPETRGIVSLYEMDMIEETLHLSEMDIIALRNLRDFTVLHLGRSEKMEDWDRMSAIATVIDMKISELGGDV
jgi:hypothetical protein